MVLFSCQTKFLFVTFLTFYSFYLVTFKCAKLQESSLEHDIKQVFHPLSHTHNTLCDSLNGGINYASPYVAKVHGFLDEHVHSHPTFVKYGIEAKIQHAKGQYYKYVYPYVVKVFEYFEIGEAQVSEHAIKLYKEGQKLYAEKVVPKFAA